MWLDFSIDGNENFEEFHEDVSGVIHFEAP